MLTIETGATAVVSVKISKDTSIGQYNDTLHATDLGPSICAELVRAEATNTPIALAIKQQIKDMAQARVQNWKDRIREQQLHPYVPTRAEKIEAANSIAENMERQFDQVLTDATVRKAECRLLKDRLQAEIDKINEVIARLQV